VSFPSGKIGKKNREKKKQEGRSVRSFSIFLFFDKFRFQQRE